MVDFNDLVTLLCEPTEQFDIDSSPLLDAKNEEEARLDSFSPFISPTKELLGDFPASCLTPPQEKLAGPLPEAQKFPQSSPLSNLKLDSPIPSSFRLDSPKVPALAQAFSVPNQSGLQDALCEAQQSGVTKLECPSPTQEQSRQGRSQQALACEEDLLTPQSKDRRTVALNLPKDRFLTGRERLETAASHCLPRIAEKDLREVLANCLPLLLRKDLEKVLKEIVSRLDGEAVEELCAWPAAMSLKSKANREARGSNSVLHPFSREDVDVSKDGQPSNSLAADLLSQGEMAGIGSGQPNWASPDVVVVGEPGALMTNVQHCIPSQMIHEPVAEMVNAERFERTVNDSSINPMNAKRASVAFFPEVLPAEEACQPKPTPPLQPTAQHTVSPGIAKTIVKPTALSSKKESSRKQERASRNTQKGVQRNTVPENGVPSRYLETWKQTVAQKEARDNASKSRAKRRLASIGSSSCEPSSKRPAVAVEPSTEVTKSMSEVARYIAKKHQDVRRRNIEKRKESDLGSQEGSVTPGSVASSIPSRFCHLCTRTASLDVLLVCSNVSRGTCRKVICFRCVGEQGWSLPELLADQNWTCTHCKKVRPPSRKTFLGFSMRISLKTNHKPVPINFLVNVSEFGNGANTGMSEESPMPHIQAS